EELNLKLNGDGLPMSDEELAALAEVEAEANSDNVTDDLSEIDYTKEEQELKIKQEEERHEMQ
ncbi:MAG: hypothetical protein II253_07895, partial [Lachnospiraceae bacterium]|nr:hypothetical protein [Lachnospiraceae bacterium]